MTETDTHKTIKTVIPIKGSVSNMVISHFKSADSESTRKEDFNKLLAKYISLMENKRSA